MADESTPKTRTVILAGKSRGHERREKVSVDAETAERLVRDGLAQFPPSKKAVKAPRRSE